jgi:NAD(P)-dependent dehydrogenase (short-subunit alcohol dehydrogenase family)
MSGNRLEGKVDVGTEGPRLLQGVALRDISSPEDVANLALFLASNESRTITGQSIPVDAGSYMQGREYPGGNVAGSPSCPSSWR